MFGGRSFTKALLGYGVLASLLCFFLVGTTTATDAPAPPSLPPCRFALQYTIDEILSSEESLQSFLNDVGYWEGQFQQDGAGYSAQWGLTYDGHAINYTTGELVAPLHGFSAPSKESIHVSLLALAIDGNPLAQTFVAASSPLGTNATALAIQILEKKMSSYELFNATYPGFAGFLPWFALNESGIYPVSNWLNAVPALDNGELVWALRAAALVLNRVGETELGSRYMSYFLQMANNSQMVFYEGLGMIRAVTEIVDTKALPTPENYQAQQGCNCYLDDPYEGELFAFLMDLYGTWPNPAERDEIWVVKQALLRSVEYVINSTTSITVQEGWWFSSHEQWKYMELPYMDIPINARVFLNGERARTWNSYLKGYPGLFASVTNVTANGTVSPNYLSAAGISEIAFQESQTNYVITPYGSFPVILASKPVGLAWYLNTIQGPSMQGPYGSTESISIDGTEICPVITWDSKITTVLAMAGGITNLTRAALEEDGTYDRFYSVVDTQWSLKFPTLNGEDLPFALPPASIPHQSSQYPNALTDFPTCTTSSGSMDGLDHPRR